MEHYSLDARIDRIDEYRQEARDGRRDWRSVWDLIKEIGAEFKQVRYPTRAEHNTAWSRYQARIDEVKAAQTEQREEQARQAADVTARIDQLEAQAEGFDGRRGGKELWDTIRDLNHAIRDTRFPSRSERESAQRRVQAIVAEVKARQDDDRRQRDEASTRSARLRDEITALIDAVDLPGPYSEIFAMLMGEGDHQEERWRYKLEEASRQIRDAWRAFNERKDEMLGRDKSEAFRALQDEQAKVNAAWESYKAGQHEARERRRLEHEARMQEHNRRTQENIWKLEERLKKLNEALYRREAHLSDLQAKLYDARSDEYRERVYGWMNEEQERIQGIRGEIDKVEGWLEEARERLR